MFFPSRLSTRKNLGHGVAHQPVGRSIPRNRYGNICERLYATWACNPFAKGWGLQYGLQRAVRLAGIGIYSSGEGAVLVADRVRAAARTCSMFPTPKVGPPPPKVCSGLLAGRWVGPAEAQSCPGALTLLAAPHPRSSAGEVLCWPRSHLEGERNC